MMMTGIRVIPSTGDEKQSWMSNTGVRAFLPNDVAASRRAFFKTKCSVTTWKSSKLLQLLLFC
jgi:hypothetical protein